MATRTPKARASTSPSAVPGPAQARAAAIPPGEMLSIGMRNQVDNFVAFTKTGDIPKFDPANTMFFFAGGLNDRGKPDGYTRTDIEGEI